MSIVVTIAEDGKEQVYFRITEDRVERPDDASVYEPELPRTEGVEAKVILALQAIQREEDKWVSAQTTPEGITYPWTASDSLGL